MTSLVRTFVTVFCRGLEMDRRIGGEIEMVSSRHIDLRMTGSDSGARAAIHAVVEGLVQQQKKQDPVCMVIWQPFLISILLL